VSAILPFPERPSDLTKLRISIVQYLNTAPLVWGFTRGPLQGKYDLSFTVPSLCAEALRKGDTDVAIIPAIEYQRIDDLVILPGLAIASKGRVRSLLILSKTPIESARRIALDASSRSTQALTKILCHHHWKVTSQFLQMSPDPSAMLQRADAALLIGDPALRVSVAIDSVTSYEGARRGLSGEQIFPAASAGIDCAETVHIYDVVEEWRKLTSLPAVLAVWAARPAVVTADLVADFQSSLAFGLQHLEQITRQGTADLNLPEADLRRYLTENIDYALDDENLQGLLCFFHLSAALNLTASPKPIQLAAQPQLPVAKST